jgi:hypothetical protein
MVLTTPGLRPAGPRTGDSSGAHAFRGVCVRHDPTAASASLSGERGAITRWRGFIEARTGMPPGIPGGAMCVQRFDDSLNSAIHITYRISLRSSSMREPRDPLLKVLTHVSVSQSDCGRALLCLSADLPRAQRGRGEATWKGYAEGFVKVNGPPCLCAGPTNVGYLVALKVVFLFFTRAQTPIVGGARWARASCGAQRRCPGQLRRGPRGRHVRGQGIG